MKSLAPLVLAGVTVLGAGAVAVAQPRADATRQLRTSMNALVFAPNGPMLKAFTLDQAEPTADLLWMRSVLVFGERWRLDPDPTWIAWLRGTILATLELDPGWRSPYFYGGSLLRVLGDVDGSDEVFKRGFEALPNDGYFAFSYAMNLYLYREDPIAAAEWMDKAAHAPAAATWYTAAAAALRSHGGDREGAIAYLESERTKALSEPQRADLDMQLGRLYHDRLVEQFHPACESYLEAHHAPPPSPEAFFAWANTAVPTNPRGDAWVVGGDGCIRSDGAEKGRMFRLRRAEAPYLK